MPFRRLILLAALLLGACGQHLPTYRYRMTVEVDTPEGLRTGSSVIEVRSSEASNYAIPNPRLLSRKISGEAIAVDLPSGQTLFALLSKPGLALGAGAANYAFDAVHPSGSNYAQQLAELRRQGAPRILAPKDYPLMIRFRDINDPKTVEAVMPNALDRPFAKGTTLRRIVVQITNDPVTYSLFNRLSWLKDSSRGGLLSGDKQYDQARPERNQSYLSFVQGSFPS